MRIRLNKGFFQEMVRENTSADTQGDHDRSGNVVSKSSFSFRSPVIQMNFPNSSNAWFPENSIVSEYFNRIEGVEFEMIYNEGQRILIIDGLKVNSSLASISAWNILGQTGIDFEFTLGHQPEFSPRIDELFIDELEIFPWQGKYPN